MRGHEPLIAMRMRGRLPAAVYLNADGNSLGDWTVPVHAAAPLFAEINVDPSEAIARLDLRCLVGLTVHLNGSNPMRVSALKDACMEAGAKRVIAYCQDWTDDTDGALTWPKSFQTL